MPLPSHHLELLAPARTVDIGREAIIHGADAVYIGGPNFGARHNAGNTLADIAGLVEFAHRYHARIFVTLNTILHDSELEPARLLIHDLHDAGVDALIVQDMGILELDIPPIALHASTQCDIRSVEKARFLAESGFSQLVLARELTVEQVQAIHDAVPTPLEYFVHGALCVAFSGQCFISHAQTGRSANRGDCSQACRLPYTLSDAEGRVVAYDSHLLSVKDNNQSANLRLLIEAGIRSFKIEGRYKDADYVKNITAHYRQLLDAVLEERPDLQAASSGRSHFLFQPNPEKTFHRGSTDYFTRGRQMDIGAFDSPKFVGLPLGTVTQVGENWFDLATHEVLANGDGLNYMNKRDVVGVQANRAQDMGHGVWRIFPNEPMHLLPGLKPGCSLNRNRDHHWELALQKKSADRKIELDMDVSEQADGLRLTLTDTDGCTAYADVAISRDVAEHAERAYAALRQNLSKLGATVFQVRQIVFRPSQPWFIPASTVNAWRREAVAALEEARARAYVRPQRLPALVPPAVYPEISLTYLANVYNAKARAFYEKHGVQLIAAAYEAHEEAGEVSLMITKHCLRFSFNLCPKQAKGVQGVQGQIKAEPMTLVSGNERLTLTFDCKPCEMHVVGKMKKHIFQAPPPSTVAVPITLHRKTAGHAREA